MRYYQKNPSLSFSPNPNTRGERHKSNTRTLDEEAEECPKTASNTKRYEPSFIPPTQAAVKHKRDPASTSKREKKYAYVLYAAHLRPVLSGDQSHHTNDIGATTQHNKYYVYEFPSWSILELPSTVHDIFQQPAGFWTVSKLANRMRPLHPRPLSRSNENKGIKIPRELVPKKRIHPTIPHLLFCETLLP